MSSIVSGWLPLIFTTLGAGAVGSVITTYGAQGRARRKARSRAMAALERIDSASRVRPGGEGFGYDQEAFAQLGACCLVAGVPQQPFYWFSAISDAAHANDMDPGSTLATYTLINYSSRMINLALWHPVLSRMVLPVKLWRLRRAIRRCSKIRAMRFLNRIYSSRDTERLGYVRGWALALEHEQRTADASGQGV